MKNIEIDKTSRLPIYQQITQQIRLAIENGDLKSGDQLPTEREFCIEYGIARGTVKRAYRKLQQDGIISVTQGKGTFIRGTDPQLSSFDIIEKYLDQLLSLSFSLDDIELFVADKLKERGETQLHISACIIDSCPEILSILSKSLQTFNILITQYSMDQIIRNGAQLVESADLIIALKHNSRSLEKLIPESSSPILPVSASLSPHTLAKLALIPSGSEIALLCRTRHFAEIVRTELVSLDSSMHFSAFVSADKSLSSLESYLLEKNVLLVEPSYKSYISPPHFLAVDNFLKGNGTVIPLEYSIDDGSLLYIEEVIRKFHFKHYNILY